MQLIHLSEELITRVVDGREAPVRRIPAATALALGSFDGLHLGHGALIAAIKGAQGRSLAEASCLFTFRGHPRLVLDGRGPLMLTSWHEKLALLQSADLDTVVVADFCPALARVGYDAFVRNFLVGMLGMVHLVGGHDAHLGANRGGTATSLAELGTKLGYTFEEVPAECLPDGRLVSSSAIRRLLAAGDVADAASMLGRPYGLWGEVGYGDGTGQEIGFPTANIEALEADKLLPAPGVYAVKVHVPQDAVLPTDLPGALALHHGVLPEMDGDGELRGILDTDRVVFRGMLNHGTAPTVHPGGLDKARLEVHILDFSGYIRERSLKIEWIARLRDEKTFGSIDELRAQLSRDEQLVRDLVR